MAAIFQIRRGDSSNTSSLQNGELYLNTAEHSLQVGTNSNPVKLLSLNTASFGDIILTGSAYISGDIALGGTITIGDTTSDSVIFNADLSSSIIPDANNTYDLGNSAKWYRNIYVNTVSASVLSGSFAGIGNLELFSQSVDNRLDRVEASSSLYDNAMSGSNRLYVSPDGSDTNDGKEPFKPFKTIKAAVESLGVAEYTNIKRYTIFVGSGNYTEQNPIAVPPGVAIVGDTLRTVRLTAANPTKDFFHVHDSNYFYGLRFLDLKHPSFAFSFPSSTATSTISAGGVGSISIVHSLSGYTDGTNQDLGIIIEGPNVSGSIASATADVVDGVITQINVTNTGDNYVSGEKPHISIPAPVGQRPVITTSPYVQNCSSITGPFNTSGVKVLQALPYDEATFNIDEQGAGGGIRIDGNLVHPNSPLESFVADAFTQVNQGGPGHLVINKGYAQFVSCFTTFCTYGFKVANGGFANISNSVIDFGKYGLVSKTYFPETYNTGSSLETKTSTVSGFVIDENGAGYTGSVAGVTISGGGASVNATAEATINANGSIDEIVLLTPGSGYTTQPSVTIDTPTGPGAIQATTVNNQALISGVTEILMALEFGTRGIDISSNMILNGVDYLVTDVQEVSGQPNRRKITTYPAPPSVATNDQIKFHQLSNISTGGLVMEYVGSGVTYNALPKYGGVPVRTREINEYAPGRVFYSTVDNIGNLKIGDFFSVNQLTGEVTIDANSFNLSGLNAIGPFKRNGVAAGVVLQEVSNNVTLLNSQGLYGEDTVPTQYAVKEYVNAFTSSTNVRLSNLEITSASVKTSIAELNSYTQSLKTAITVDGVNTTILGNLAVLGTTTTVNSNEVNIGDNILHLNYGYSAIEAGLQVTDVTGGSVVSGSLLWDGTTDYWKAGKKGSESKILLAGGDSILSSSLQLTQLNQHTQSLNDFTASVTASLEKIYQTTSSLNLFSASVTASLVSINDTTASLNTSIANINLTTASLNTSVANINTFTQSANIRLTELETASGSVKTSINALNAYTNSLVTRWDNLASYTGSINNFTASVTSSLEKIYQTTASLNAFTASTSQSIFELNGTASNHEGRIDYLELAAFGGVDVQAISSSVSKINSVSGSWITESETGSFEKVADATHTLVSSSTQLGNYVATITGTSNQVLVAGSGLNSASITLSTPQDIATTSDVEFNNITASAGIRAAGDIIAYYSSDERLKENIQPIQNALSKVELISGNTYDWKEGFENIHPHKGNDVGVIAQEIEKVLPEVVIERINGYKAVDYEKIVPLLIEAIKELSTKVKELENK